jgi:hypothetical protein
MIPIDASGVSLIPITTHSAAGTSVVGAWDTKGYNRANIYLMGRNNSAASSGFVSSIILAEHDTDTSYSNQTAIKAFTGGTATSTSVGFVIDKTGTASHHRVAELQIDLRKRKRYLSLYVVTDQGQTNWVSGIALFSRAEDSKDTAAEKVRNNLINTTEVKIGNVVTG